MTARATMAELITELRTVIGDPAGGSAVFTDDQLQNFLDNWRTDVFAGRLVEQPSVGAGGVATYRDYYAGESYAGSMWEGGELLQDGGFNTLTADVAERRRGHCRFNAGQAPPVYITGAMFAVYAAAADACEAWLAKIKFDFDFQADGASFSRAQKVIHLEAQLARLRAQTQPLVAQMVRDD